MVGKMHGWEQQSTGMNCRKTTVCLFYAPDPFMYSIGWTQPVGTLYELDFEAYEFARVMIGADFQHGGIIEGSRCSDKLHWVVQYAAELEQISNQSGNFIWAKRTGSFNYVGE